MQLAAGNAFVRSWRKEDAPDIVPHANDVRVWRNMRDAFPHPYHLEDAQRFIALAAQMSPETYFAIEAEDRAVGGVGYTLHTDVERIGAELGYWLGAEFWGRGIVTGVVRAITAYAFETHPELCRMYAVPFSWNPASARVLEKAGYRREGTLRQSALKDGQVLDQWMYAIVRGELSRSSNGP
jgi:RimJ/RimL family protein N-acetyltransferase